jgi:hypothetical protein
MRRRQRVVLFQRPHPDHRRLVELIRWSNLMTGISDFVQQSHNFIAS